MTEKFVLYVYPHSGHVEVWPLHKLENGQVPDHPDNCHRLLAAPTDYQTANLMRYAYEQGWGECSNEYERKWTEMDEAFINKVTGPQVCKNKL